jgi:predicted RNase H-like HicB family nuclease
MGAMAGRNPDDGAETWRMIDGYKVVLTPDDGQIAVRVPFFPGLFTWGATEDEALASAREAIDLALLDADS